MPHICADQTSCFWPATLFAGLNGSERIVLVVSSLWMRRLAKFSLMQRAARRFLEAMKKSRFNIMLRAVAFFMHYPRNLSLVDVLLHKRFPILLRDDVFRPGTRPHQDFAARTVVEPNKQNS